MKTETIEIPVKVLDKATRETKAINKGLAQTGSVAKKTSLSFTELNSALSIAQQGFQTLKQVYDFAKEGANIEFAQERFDRLAASIGTTGDVLLGKMNEATKGTLSDMEAMAAATDLLSLGLAKTQDEAIRLATVQAGLGMDINQLVLTLTNQTTMRFDALGVSVDGFKDKVKALEEQGYDTNAAFQEAFLQQAEEQLVRVGNAADSSIGTFKRLEAQLKNITDRTKEGVSNALEPQIKAYLDAADAVEEFNRITGKNLTLEQYRNKQVQDNVRETINAYNDEMDALRDLDKGYEDRREALVRTGQAAAEVVTVTKEMTSANRAYLNLVGSISNEQDNYNDKMADYEEKLKDVAWSYGNNTQRVIDLRAKIEEMHEKGANPKKIEKYEAALKNIPLVFDETTAAAQEVRQEMDEYTQEFELNSKRRILAGVEEKLAVEGLSEEETQYIEDLGVLWGVYTESAVNSARETRAQIDAIADAFGNLPSEKSIRVNIETAGSFDRALMNYNNSNYAGGTGGWRTVPPGYPNDSYSVGLSSGEKFNVVPQGQSGGGSGIDENALARAIVTAMQRAQ